MPRTEVFNRDKVISNATAVFHRKGYNATSMQDLVDATGLNRSSIYNSFNSKIELYLDCLIGYNEDYKDRTTVAIEQTNNAFEKIEVLFDIYICDINEDKEQKGCLITNCKSEMGNQNDTISVFLKKHQSKTLAFLESLIIDGQTDGSINQIKSAKAYALYVFSSLQGLRMTGIFVKSKAELKGIVDSILQTLK